MVSIQAEGPEWLQGILLQYQYKIEANHRKILTNIIPNTIKPIYINRSDNKKIRCMFNNLANIENFRDGRDIIVY